MPPTWLLRFHLLMECVRPHTVALSPYVQILARGISGALGWIRPALRGRGSRGGHGRGWPAARLPAQVSTGWHERPFTTPKLHPHAEDGLPQLKSSSEPISGQKVSTSSFFGLSQLELVLRSGVAKSGSSVRLKLIAIKEFVLCRFCLNSKCLL